MSVSTFANSARDFEKHWESQRIEFPATHSPHAHISPGRYPRLLNFVYERLLDWNPTGQRVKYSAVCDPELWSQRLLDPLLSNVQLQGALLQKYFQDCDKELKTHSSSTFLKMMTMRMDFKNHPFLHRVKVHLPGDIRLRGLLALKGDRKKRPMVVLRLGIFGGTEELLAERYLLLQLFEQSPFNLLILDNMSSPEFIADNSRFSFGGYDEGLQNIIVAKYLRDPLEPLSQIVQSLHFVGVSLGGHGVLYASLLNELNQKPIQSFLGICPVVHLRPSLKNLNGSSLRQKLINLWAASRMKGLREKNADLRQASSFTFMSSVDEFLHKNYTGGLSYYSGIRLPKGVEDRPDFRKLNDFWWAYNEVKAPVLILATEKDEVVPFALNSKFLKKKNIKIVSFNEGEHCTFPIPYQWGAFTSLLQSYILSHSSGFKLMEEKLVLDVSDEKVNSVSGRMSFEVSWPGGKEKFVRIELGDFQLSLPIDNFDFQFIGDKRSEPEKRMLERWLQQNLKVYLQSTNKKKLLTVSWLKAL